MKNSAGFKLAKAVLLVFLAAANSGVLAQLFSDQQLGRLWPSSLAAPGPTVQALTLLGAMGVRQNYCGAHTPWCLRCGLRTP